MVSVRDSVGALARSDVRTLRLSGPDRVRFLDGMITNDVKSLAPGQGCLAIKTTNRGRIEATMRVRDSSDAFLLDVRDVVAEKLLTTLDMFIIMDDCEIADVSEGREVITALGPDAQAAVAKVAALESWPDDHAFSKAGEVTVIRDRTLGVPGYELHFPPGAVSIEALGAPNLSATEVDILRIESGVPIDGRDLDDDTIPLEARLEHAIDFEKGCYVGQEVIARANNLGQVNHLLVGLTIDGEALPPEESALHLPGNDRAVGELTSVVRSPQLGPIALGYVHRKAEAEGTELEVRFEDRKLTCKTTSLPFIGTD